MKSEGPLALLLMIKKPRWVNATHQARKPMLRWGVHHLLQNNPMQSIAKRCKLSPSRKNSCRQRGSDGRGQEMMSKIERGAPQQNMSLLSRRASWPEEVFQ